MPELRAREISHWFTEVRMVQQIEHFCPEVQLDRLVNREVAMDCKVTLRCAETSKRISPQISLPKWIAVCIGGWRTKGAYPVRTIRTSSRCQGVINRLPSRILRSKQIERDAANDIRPNIWGEAVRELAKVRVEDVYRRGGLSFNDALQGPTAENHIRESIELGGRNIIGHRRGKRVANVKVGWSPVRV